MCLIKKKDKSLRLKQEILKETIDFGNVITSGFHAKGMYDELKVKYHPDRFLDKQMKAKADNLYQRITENKENYNAMLGLKELAEKELTFND